MVAVYLGLGVALAQIDLRHHLLPDGLTLALAIAGATALALSQRPFPWDWLVFALAIGALPRIWLWLLPESRLARLGLGSGDLALLGALVLWVGPILSVASLLVAAVLMLPVVVGGMLLRGWGRTTPLPLGPALIAAGLVHLLWPHWMDPWL